MVQRSSRTNRPKPSIKGRITRFWRLSLRSKCTIILSMPSSNRVRYIVFKDAATWYAVALEFNIVESGDDPRKALIALFDAMIGYVGSAAKNGLDREVLNQSALEEYKLLWR